MSSIRSEKSQPTTLPSWLHALGQREGEVAGPATDVERRIAGAHPGAVGRALAPGLVEAGGHRRFITS